MKQKIIILFNICCMTVMTQAKCIVLKAIQDYGSITWYVVQEQCEGECSSCAKTSLCLKEEPKSVLRLNIGDKCGYIVRHKCNQNWSASVQSNFLMGTIKKIQNINFQLAEGTHDFEQTRSYKSSSNNDALANASTILYTVITKNMNSYMKNSNNLKFGVILRLFRNKKQITLQQLSQKTGLSLSYLSTIENNLRKPNIDVLDKICQALGVPLEVVLILSSDSDDPFVKNQLLPLIQSISKELYGCTEDEIVKAEIQLEPLTLSPLPQHKNTSTNTGDISEEMAANFC